MRLHSYDVANLPFLPPSPSSTLGGEGSRVRGKIISSKRNVVTGRYVPRQVNSLARWLHRGPGWHTHPIWSLDREDWVPLGELGEGETLQGTKGIVRVRCVALQKVAVPVYNIEVHGDHVYQVTKASLVVHNGSFDCGKIAKGLRGFQNKVYNVGGTEILLNASGMRHILVRHVTGFWNGKAKLTQSFLNLKQKEIIDTIGKVLQQNAAKVQSIGSIGYGQVQGVVNGVAYNVGLNRGRIGQFYPL
jgi:hypothetical protein